MPAIVEAIGPRQYSEQDAADVLTRLGVRPVAAVIVPAEARAPALIEAGLSPSYARALAGMYAALDAGAVPFSGDGPLHRGATTLETVLAAAIPTASVPTASVSTAPAPAPRAATSAPA